MKKMFNKVQVLWFSVKKILFLFKINVLTLGKLLAFKLAFSRLSLWNVNWVWLFIGFVSEIIIRISSMGCHDNSVLCGHTYLFPALYIYFKQTSFLSVSVISAM